jgi:hypothetical protein
MGTVVLKHHPCDPDPGLRRLIGTHAASAGICSHVEQALDWCFRRWLVSAALAHYLPQAHALAALAGQDMLPGQQ